jgi:hypothetical protein
MKKKFGKNDIQSFFTIILLAHCIPFAKWIVPMAIFKKNYKLLHNFVGHKMGLICVKVTHEFFHEWRNHKKKFNVNPINTCNRLFQIIKNEYAVFFHNVFVQCF